MICFHSLVLQNVPMKPRSAWQVFIREHLKGTKTTQEGLTKSSTELSAKWKALSGHEKQVRLYTLPLPFSLLLIYF